MQPKNTLPDLPHPERESLELTIFNYRRLIIKIFLDFRTLSEENYIGQPYLIILDNQAKGACTYYTINFGPILDPPPPLRHQHHHGSGPPTPPKMMV